MKKLLLVLVSLVLVLGLSACKTEEEDVVLNWNIGADPATLDPTLNGASDGGDVINQTFEGLVREINGIVYPGIAESWETSADGLTVTFHLRHSNWSDGTPLTANDFVYSWLHGMNPETASEYSWIWEYTNVVGAQSFAEGEGTADAVGIKAVDDYTFEVKLVNPTAYLVSLTAFYHFLPVKQEAVEAGPDGIWAKDPELYVSNGPFKLVEYTIGEGLKLVKNDEYWQADTVMIDVINGKFIDDASTAYAAYNAGDLDFIPSVPTAEVPILIAESDEFHVYPLLGTYYYSFNMDENGDGDNNDGYVLGSDTDDGIWSNVNLRNALSYSIDREAITEVLGAGQVPAGGFVPPGFLDNNDKDFFAEAGTYGLVTDDGNYAEAVTLFATAASELGLSVDQLKAELEKEELLYNTSEGHQLIAQMVQEMWQTNLGFTMPLANQEWAVFQATRSAGDFSIARGGWLTDFMDPSGLLSIFASTNAYNDPNYYNDAFDTLLSESQATSDPAIHFAKLYEAQEMFMTDMPIIPVYHYTDSMLAKSYVVGWGRSVLGSVDFSKASIE
ncbi:MAG: peptide ABC transporter substrate-binding protein, partial [Candidatus Izimaplasma sp.]|nr:peptide ABC transporter substrate-binding protein [Candidatus Izimaplasma bacterium]